jgi:tagatose 6-phosphate kinase
MIVCIGTTPCYQRTMTFERLTIDAVNRTGLVHDYASGKSVNVARVLHELGESHLSIGFAGGSRGNQLLADMTTAGITHDFVIVDRETRQCITLIADGDGTATELVEESLRVGDIAWTKLAEKLQEQAERTSAGDIWIFSGTLPPGAPADAYARIVPSVLARGAQVVADLSGEPLRRMLAIGNVIAKINQQELDATFDSHKPSGVMPDQVEQEIARGNRFVITLGKHGAVAADATGTWRIQTIPLRAISAVGSGDAFAAGLCAGLSRGQALPEACKLGAACGAANALTPHSGHVRKADVERFLREITANLSD